MSFSVLWLPTIISALLFMPFGAFFYSSKGMGNQWLNAIGKTKEDIEQEQTNMGLLMGGTVVISIVTVFLVSVLIASVNVTTFIDLLLLVFVVYFIVLLIRLKNALFDGNLELFKVNMIGIVGEFIITLVVFTFFIG